MSEQPDAYLIKLRRPGMQTVYASVDEHERHDGVSDEVWQGREVEPLYTLKRIEKEGRLEGLRQARDMFIVGSVSHTLLCEVIEAVDNEFDDPCPDCGKQLKVAQGGGVKCSCGYWFCY